MDIISHGLWGGVVFGRKNRKTFWQALGFGILPDLLSFGLFTIADVLGMVSGPDWGKGHPDPSSIPQIIHTLYNFTHSFIVFAGVFGLVWIFRRKPFLPMFAWGLHILLDIPTHSTSFFPTPFLFPVSDFVVNGISWGQPIIFYPNITFLFLCYLFWYLYDRKKSSGKQ